MEKQINQTQIQTQKKEIKKKKDRGMKKQKNQTKRIKEAKCKRNRKTE